MAIIDSPERMEIRREQVFGPPDWVIGREWSERVFVLRKDLLHQALEASVKFRFATTGFSENETALLDVFAEISERNHGKLGFVVAIEVGDWGLKQIGHCGDAGIEDLPGQQGFPVAAR